MQHGNGGSSVRAGSLLGNSKGGQDKGGERWESHLGLAGRERKVLMVSMDIHYPVEVSRCNCTLVRACHAALRVYSLENDLNAPKCVRVHMCPLAHVYTHTLARTHTQMLSSCYSSFTCRVQPGRRVG